MHRACQDNYYSQDYIDTNGEVNPVETMTKDELAKLKSEFPSDWQERIERVSGYCASKGTSYKNYLATIRNWAKRDAKNKDQPARQPYRKNDVAGGYQRLMEILGGDEND